MKIMWNNARKSHFLLWMGLSPHVSRTVSREIKNWCQRSKLNNIRDQSWFIFINKLESRMKDHNILFRSQLSSWWIPMILNYPPLSLLANNDTFLKEENVSIFPFPPPSSQCCSPKPREYERSTFYIYLKSTPLE